MALRDLANTVMVEKEYENVLIISYLLAPDMHLYLPVSQLFQSTLDTQTQCSTQTSSGFLHTVRQTMRLRVQSKVRLQLSNTQPVLYV